MRVIETILFEYILGYVLQAFSSYIGIYAICKKNIDIKKYLMASSILTVVLYVMRLLPINYGIHTILNSICFFLLGVFYLKLPPLQTIKAIIIIMVILLFIEFGDIYSFSIILGKDKFDSLMKDNLYQSIVALPTTIIFAIVNLLSYYFLVIRKRKKSVVHGENCA